MKYFMFSALVLVLSCGGASKQYTALRPQNSKLFVAPMDIGLVGFITAEIIKRKLPVQLVTNDSIADLVLVGYSEEVEKTKWYHTVFGSNKDKNVASIKLLSTEGQVILWASEAGDRSLWWGNLRRGGMRKVAERLVKNLKKYMDNEYAR